MIIIKNLTVNDFFCGCGGFGLGFKQAGFELVGAWDFDKYAVKSYAHNVSPKVKLMDITEMTADDVPYADVWTFGTPCQAFSVAGKQLGTKFKCIHCDHEEEMQGEEIIDRNTKCSKCGSESKAKDLRGVLFFEVMRLLKTTNPNKLPKVILLENVKGIRKFIPTVKNEYEKRGYKMYYTLYNSKFWGVPQNRERYFIVGVHNSINKDFIFPTENKNNIPQLHSILEHKVDESFFLPYEKCKSVIEAAKSGELTEPDLDLKQIASISKEELNDNERQRRVYSTNGISPSLLARSDGAKILVKGLLDMKASKQIRQVYGIEGIAPTCDTCEGGHRQTKILDDYRVRKLTPREYARLQGFPDSFEQVVSNTQFYKQMGNAVTVNVSKGIAESIKEFLYSL